MTTVQKSIEVNVPVHTAYNQWTQFEEFPHFMDGIKEVQQIDDARLFWVAEVGGERKEWFARITRQVPDQVVAWQSEGGSPNSGLVSFHAEGTDKTEIEVHMEYEPTDFKEQAGGALGVASRRVEGDLKRFKEFIEARGKESGAWRGEISGGMTAEETQRYGATGQGGTGYGGTTPSSVYPGTPGTLGRPQ